jgi:hypothetical protein
MCPNAISHFQRAGFELNVPQPALRLKRFFLVTRGSCRRWRSFRQQPRADILNLEEIQDPSHLDALAVRAHARWHPAVWREAAGVHD